MGKLTVGQKLWYVPGDRCSSTHKPREVTVTAVGRKWATLNTRHRVDMETLLVEYPGMGAQDSCRLTREEWEREMACEMALWAIKNGIRPREQNEGLTLDAIYQAAALLGIELPARGESDHG